MGKYWRTATSWRFSGFCLIKNCINRELADELKLSAATISYHMSVLTDLELVHTTVSANKIIYSLNREKMEYVMDCLTDYICHLEQQ